MQPAISHASLGSTGFLTYGCNKVDVEVVQAERTLKIVIGDIGNGLAIDLESLDGDVSFKCQQTVGLGPTYNTEVIKIIVLIGLLKGGPCIIGAHVCNARLVKDTPLLTLRSLMA